jgi:hypothetical protein
MAITKANFRIRVRAEAGDDERLTGTANGGSTLTITSAALMQSTNYWKGLNAYIITTTNGLAPQGESKKIASSDLSVVTVETPFSAIVESGDTFGIAVFSRQRIDDIISDSLAEFSLVKPQNLSETLNMSPGIKRIAPTSATSQGFRPDRIEFFDNIAQSQYEYRKEQSWIWNTTLKQIEWAWWWSEQKALTLYGVKDHILPAGESGNMTLDDEDIGNVVKVSGLNILMSMSDVELRDNFGHLKPKSFTRGDVRIDYGASSSDYKSLRQTLQDSKDKILEKYRIGLYLDSASIPSGTSIDTKADPDGYPMPQVFWEKA